MSRMIIPKEAIQGKTITKKAYESLRDIFADYDMNASGTVDFQEFLLAFEGYPSRPEDTWRQRIAGSLFTRMDANNDGDITFRELLLAYFPRCSPEDVDRYMSMYEPKTEADLRLQRECARLAFCEDEFTLEQEHDLERVMGQFDTNKVSDQVGSSPLTRMGAQGWGGGFGRAEGLLRGSRDWRQHRRGLVIGHEDMCLLQV
eukprot:TRINITY_DN316_c0_g1_i17.p1 TRINITY_DN316_c0_g1~~TRINITY_DN316_c0_g1_i17.p1  ORF type:complete len:202 (+),score=27.76 TRINITY_DN316_c0_g1_i17:128-733(+)